MPTYTYVCAAGAEFEVQQRITEPKLTECPLCEKCVPKRLISSAPEFALKEGPSGSWSSSGYGHTPAQLSAMRKLGKLTRRV
jgi:putative FmdB family regulatory protein